MRKLTLTACLLVAAGTGSARAASIDVTGAPGADGVAGAPGDPGQPGGAGGVGEDVSVVSTSIDYSNQANATGGTGGAGGAGGAGLPPGANGGAGGTGGAGGAASASSSVTTDQDIQVYMNAIGGDGGAGGAGGDASSGGVLGPAGAGGPGGAATAELDVTTTGDQTSGDLTAFAQGGTGGASPLAGGDGGTATARAAGTASDTGGVFVLAIQRGGNGGASETAAGRGADSTMVDAVSGDGELVQNATGGNGGEGPGSRGGDARSELTVDGGSHGFSLGSYAYGGSASSPDGSPAGAARGGDATASVLGVDHDGRFLGISGGAYGGGARGPNSQPGEVSLSVIGQSTAGGFVHVFGEAVGGSGRVGGSVALDNAVTGATTGVLSIEQTAQGGDGSELTGSASSRLHQSGSWESLSLIANGHAGYGLYGTPVGNNPTEGATGFAQADAVNDAGGAYAEANGFGAYRGDGSDGAGGGDGEAHANATGATGATAIAYAGGGAAYSSGAAPAGNPGNALASASAISSGTTEVFSNATAIGGTTYTAGDPSARGGIAHAEATASGAGTSLVHALALASLINDSGVSLATGSTSAHSAATGPGLLIATAESVGASSLADSRASSTGGVRENTIELTPRGPQEFKYPGVASEADFRLNYALNRADYLGNFEGFKTYTLVNALPDAGEVAQVVADNPTVLAGVASASQLLGLGIVTGADGFEGTTSLTFERALLGASGIIEVGFVDAAIPAAGFERLELQLELDGEQFADLQFTDASLAASALHDVIYAFKPGANGDPLSTLVVRYILDLEGNPDATFDEVAFASDFVVFSGPVPEPAVSELFAAALLALTLARAARGAR